MVALRKKMKTKLSTWWAIKNSDEAAEAAINLAKNLISADMNRRMNYIQFDRLYDNRPYDITSSGIINTSIKGYGVSDEDQIEGLVYNAIKSIIDTLVANIAKNKPLPKFLTTDGDFSEQRRAKLLTRFIEAQFNHLDVHKFGYLALRDACIYGTGVLKVSRDEDRLLIERIRPSELFVPAAEAWYGTPRQIHHRYYVQPSVLVELFPKEEDAIFEAAGKSLDASGFHVLDNPAAEYENPVEVIESWHLPSRKGAKDGRHMISIVGASLLDEDWAHQTFPFSIIHHDHPVQGFWGQGITEAFRPMQAMLNENVQLIAQSIRLTARPIVLTKAGSNIVNREKMFDNAIGKVYEVSGMEDLKVVAVGAVPEVAVAQRNEIFDKMFALSGVSKLMSQGVKPSGLDAAVAMREFMDIQGDRSAVLQQSYEKLFLDLAENLIRLAREASEEGYDIDVKVNDKNSFRKIKWSEVDIDDARLNLDLMPASSLPRTPAGRLQFVQELLNSQMMTPEEGLRALGFPDVEAINSVKNASVEDINRTLEKLLAGEEYEAPEPMQNLEQGIKIFQGSWLKYRDSLSKTEDGSMILEKLQMWIADANAMLEAAAPPPEAMPPPSEPMPS